MMYLWTVTFEDDRDRPEMRHVISESLEVAIEMGIDNLCRYDERWDKEKARGRMIGVVRKEKVYCG